MTTNQDEKPKKLTLNKDKLSRGIDPIGVKRTTIGSRANTVVEIKHSRKNTSSLSFNMSRGLGPNDSETTVEEQNKRLSLLKKAVDTKSNGRETRISSLSDLAEVNIKSLKLETVNNANDVYIHNDIQSNDEQSSIGSTKLAQDPKNQIKNEHNKSHIVPYDDEIAGENKKVDLKPSGLKHKLEASKKLKKTDILHMLDSDESGKMIKARSLAAIRRAKEKEKRKQEIQKPEKIYREVIVPDNITVAELASRMAERGADVIRELMQLGVMVTIHQLIDADTAELIVNIFGHSVKRVQESDVENALIQEVDSAEDLMPRAPVVTVMGHVDHGKTSLLDALRSTDVVSGEAGGITQHIGAYRVHLPNNKAITFIDTPGHEAFTAMRVRGTQVTDIAILVVAADDGIKAQTVEAIYHAKAAAIPIIVAINKIDKPNVNINQIKHELLAHELIAEDMGGDVMIVPVSALSKINLDKLEEAILLLAEMQELKANPNVMASGVVIESRIEKGRGVAATVLVQRGTLKTGDIAVVGNTYGKIRLLRDDKGNEIQQALPSEPVEVYGLNASPQSGDKFNVVQHEKQAKNIIEYRLRTEKTAKTLVTKPAGLDNLFLKAACSSNITEIPLIIKGDVHGSVEAIVANVLKFSHEEVNIKILYHAIGGITESDVTLAKASKALIIGFNVRTSANSAAMAEQEGVEIRYYSIIYDLIDDIKMLIESKLIPIIREQFIGTAEIRQVFSISKIGQIAGSYVTKGVVKKGAGVRLLRDSIVIHEGKLKTLRRFKDDVKEVREGFECGIAFEQYNDIRVGDMVEVFEHIEEKRHLV